MSSAIHVIGVSVTLFSHDCQIVTTVGRGLSSITIRQQSIVAGMEHARHSARRNGEWWSGSAEPDEEATAIEVGAPVFDAGEVTGAKQGADAKQEDGAAGGTASLPGHDVDKAARPAARLALEEIDRGFSCLARREAVEVEEGRDRAHQALERIAVGCGAAAFPWHAII